MATGIRRHRTLFTTAVLALLAAGAVVATPAGVRAAETPRRGGVLLAVIAAEPPSLDPHQESTFANIQLVAPFYSTLLQIDPLSFPKIIGDVATGVEDRARRAAPTRSRSGRGSGSTTAHR